MIRSKFIRERKQFSDNNKHNIYATIFADCKSSSSGGSLYFGSSDSKACVVSCTFTHCYASNDGGCIFTQRSTILQCCAFFRSETATYASAFFSDRAINASLIAISDCISNFCAYRMTGYSGFIKNINSSRQLSKQQAACYTGRSDYNENKYATFVNNTDVNGYPMCLYGSESLLSFANIISTKSNTSGNAIFAFGYGCCAEVSNCMFLDSKHSKILSFYSPNGKETVKFSNCWFDSESETLNNCTASNVMFSTNKGYIKFTYDITCKNIQFSQRVCKNSQHASYIYFYVFIAFS